MKVPYEILYDKIVNQECKLPALRGVKFFGEWAVASDNYILVAVKSTFPESFKGWTLDKDEEKIKEPFLATLNTFQIDTADAVLCPQSDLLREACDQVPESPDRDGKRLCLNVDGFNFYPARMQKALSVFDAANEKPEAFTQAAHKDLKSAILVLRSENCVALIAAVDMPQDNINSLTITDAIEIGDLL